MSSTTKIAERAIREYERVSRRGELDFPPTEEERKNVLQTWRQRLVYQAESNGALETRMIFLKRLFVFACFVFAIMIVAVRVSDPKLTKVTDLSFNALVSSPEALLFARNSVLATLFLLGVYYEWLLFFQVYAINVAAYVYARIRGVVYRPYVIYGIA